MCGGVWEGVICDRGHVSIGFHSGPDHVAHGDSYREVHRVGVQDTHTHLKSVVQVYHIFVHELTGKTCMYMYM